MKKKVLSMLLAVVLVVGLTACGGSKTESETAGEPETEAPAEEPETEAEPEAEPEAEASGTTEKKTIALVPPAMISPYYKSVIGGAQEKADELGFDLVTLAPESESDYAAQVQIVEDMITQKVDGIMLCAINGDAIVSAVKKANEAGIPVVMFNTQNELAGGEVTSYIRYDQYEAGGKVCDFVVEQLGDTLSVGIVEGLPSDHTTERMGGFVDKAEEKYPNVKVVASQPGDWEREKGMNATANMLQANPDINLFFALSDEMALGAVQAVKEGSKDVAVAGFDGNPNAVASVLAGDLLSTLSVGGPGTGVLGVEVLSKVFAGESVEKVVNVDTEVIWKENASQFPSEAD